MEVWINGKGFWAVKLIYNNENLNNSIKYDRGVLLMKMRMYMRTRMKMRNEKWEQSYELTEKKKLISCQINI